MSFMPFYVYIGLKGVVIDAEQCGNNPMFYQIKQLELQLSVDVNFITFVKIMTNEIEFNPIV